MDRPLSKRSDGIRSKSASPGPSAPRHPARPTERDIEPEEPRVSLTSEESDMTEQDRYRAFDLREESPSDSVAGGRDTFFSRLRGALPKRPQFRILAWRPAPSGRSDASTTIPRRWTPSEVHPAESGMAVVSGDRLLRGRSRWGILAGSAAVAVLFILSSTVLARLTVVVKPRVEEAAPKEIGALFDTSVSKVLFSQKVIPAERLTFSRALAKEFTASGQESIQERARGKARIYNRFGSLPQPLVSGTRFAADSGTIYRIQKGVVVPGAKIEEGKIVPQSLEVEVIADVVGEGANAAGEVTLKIPGFKGSPRYEGFYAVAPQGFSGGFEGEATVVSKDDLKAVEEEVTKTLFDELRAEMETKIPPGLSLLKGLLEIQIVKVDVPRPGTRAERFSVKAEAVGKALVFREEDTVSLLKSFAIEEGSDQEFVEGSARLEYAVKSVDFEKGRAEVALSGSLKTMTRIPEQELAALIKGKKEGSVIEFFKTRRELASFNLAFFPPWRSKAPSDPAKIRFRVEGP